MKVNVYIRFGEDENYRNVNTLTVDEKKCVGNKLNQQAAVFDNQAELYFYY